MTESHIDVVQKRRFYQNDITDKKEILIALHGYGQLGQFFFRKFSAIEKKIGIVIPEGPHRFYLEGSSGRVGASWMTKEWRETDIAENTQYLLSLIKAIRKVNQNAPITLLGFSQGGATAARLYQTAPDLFTQLILWASVFPPDVEKQQFKMKNKLHFVLGTKDPYFSSENRATLLNEYQKLGFIIHEFDGVHDINETTLNVILKKVA
jgi:predicted esterase